MGDDIGRQLGAMKKEQLDLRAFEALTGVRVHDRIGSLNEEELMKILFVQQICRAEEISYPANDALMNQFAMKYVDHAWAVALELDSNFIPFVILDESLSQTAWNSKRPPQSRNTQRAVEDPASSPEEETPELLTQKSSNKDDNPINGSDKAISSIVDEIMKKITPEPTTITETTTAPNLSKTSGKIKTLKFIFGKIKNSSDLREIVVAMVSDIAVELKSIGKTKLDLEAFEAVSGCTVCVGNMTEEELLKILFVQQVCKSKSITYPENDTEMNQFAIATVDNSWAAALQYELLTQKLWTAEYFRPSNVSNSPLEDVETIQKLLPS
ncbi:hypothetical protein GE061_007968 [Apolygus lucorum]|uniref:Uncharacterized protein n=1 Tax=Apolygus lucorum TaxID=248454 RepID=A0A8S9WQ06_APOLU|nr:hypothetical protein GE061_007968 [Apolygus lucorum]